MTIADFDTHWYIIRGVINSREKGIDFKENMDIDIEWML